MGSDFENIEEEDIETISVKGKIRAFSSPKEPGGDPPGIKLSFRHKDNMREEWFPTSQCQGWGNCVKGDMIDLEVPEWLMKKKGLL